MKKLLSIAAAMLMATLLFAAPAGAQDEPVIGTVEADPATVPEAGEYEVTANGSGYIPDTSVLLGACKAPGDTLVPGESTDEEISAAAQEIDPIIHCDVGGATSVDVDSDGNFSETVTVTIGDNFFFTAGALDGSQQGATWIPVVGAAGGDDDGDDDDGDGDDDGELAVTGVDSFSLALFGLATLGLGAGALMASRRYDLNS